MKKLIPAICMLLIAASLFGTSTYAWFSMNKQVSVSGMQIQAQADSALVITKAELPSNTTANEPINYQEQNATLLYSSTYDAAATYTTNLKYISNAADVDEVTGRIKSGKNATFADALNDSTKKTTYYVDYVIYIASAGNTMENHTLTIEFDTTKLKNQGVEFTQPITDKINAAVTVGFYYKTVSSVVTESTTDTDNKYLDFTNGENKATYLGKLNLFGTEIEEETGTETVKKRVFETLTINSLDIPKATSAKNAAIAILMRVYIDGDLSATANGTTFVNNQNVADIHAMTLGFKFTAAAAATPAQEG